MRRSSIQLVVALALFAGIGPFVGCGTTRSTDTTRTATEQLLISDAIDRAVQQVNVEPLAGQTVFLDDSRLSDVVDRNYLVSTLRQHLLANGCQLREKREDAEFIVEARAGAVGTDRNDLLFGVPSMNVPQILPLQPAPAAIPEIPIAKRKDQRGIAKLAVFAYHRETGTPVWQSGLVHQESSSNDVWILGAGPFQRGTIHAGTEFAGKALRQDESPLDSTPKRLPPVDLAHESTFATPQRLAQQPPPDEQTAIQTAHQEPVDPAANLANPTPAAPAPPDAPPTVGNTPPPPTRPAASVYIPPDTKMLPQPRFDPRE
jgi:hypothetical protein